MARKAVIFDSKDNVATALSDLEAGDTVELKIEDRTLVTSLSAAVPFGHKFSVDGIESGSPVVKYGEVIGIALGDIRPGDYVHVHNVASARGRGDLTGGQR
jgi:altronate dehydratase small subunit